MNRKPLNFDSLPAVIQTMIEDSSASAAIIDELIQEKGETQTLACLIILDDMNIRGTQINSLYKLCDNDEQKLYKKILNMTKEDIDNLNSDTFAVCKYKAIYEGTKEDRIMHPEKYLFTDEERNSLRNKKSKDRAHDILEKNQKKEDLYPSIKTNEALSIINKNGFTCGYKKTYENKKGNKITYRVFSNEYGDILYAHSLEDPDIFLWGESKLNVIRQNNHQQFENIGCNTYKNIRGIVGYNIELRENPFNTYQKILNKKEEIINNMNEEYYHSNLYPIIESINSIKYKENNKDYKSCIVASIYNLLTFPETYYDLNDNLKKIYGRLLLDSEKKAYDQIIYELNAEEGIEIAKKLQDAIGINLDKEKLIEAKKRYDEKRKNDNTIKKEKINQRITKIISEKEIIEIK